VLSGTCDRASIIGAFDAGAIGYIPKTSKPDVMIAAIKLVAAGGTYVPPEALDGGMEPADLDLTRRQKDVLRLILKGYNNERIAAKLAISPATVKQHAHAVFTALGVSTRADAVIAAARLGLSLGLFRSSRTPGGLQAPPFRVACVKGRRNHGRAGRAAWH
jgi:DNA-binding NarL/FixJ family response regulator